MMKRKKGGKEGMTRGKEGNRREDGREKWRDGEEGDRARGRIEE